MRMQTAREAQATFPGRIASPRLKHLGHMIATDIERDVSIRPLEQTWLRRDIADLAPKLFAKLVLADQYKPVQRLILGA